MKLVDLLRSTRYVTSTILPRFLLLTTTMPTTTTTTKQGLAALKMEAPIFPKAVGWRQAYEYPVVRPGAGAAAANVSVKFYSPSKVSFRIRGSEAATDWSTAGASKGMEEGAWVTYPAQAPVTVAFKVQPETETEAGKEGAVAPTAAVSVSGVEVNVAGEGVVLEWKGAGWFQGFFLYYLVEAA